MRTPVRGRMPPEPHTVKGGEPQQLGECGSPRSLRGSFTVLHFLPINKEPV